MESLNKSVSKNDETSGVKFISSNHESKVKFNPTVSIASTEPALGESNMPASTEMLHDEEGEQSPASPARLSLKRLQTTTLANSVSNKDAAHRRPPTPYPIFGQSTLHTAQQQHYAMATRQVPSMIQPETEKITSTTTTTTSTTTATVEEQQQDAVRALHPIPKVMRAAVTRDYNAENPVDSLLLMNEFPSPPISQLKNDEIVVQMMFSSVNPIDWKMNTGKYLQIVNVSPPWIGGKDGVGKIVAMGSKVTSLTLGSVVMGISAHSQFGTYGQYAIFKAAHVCKVPSSFPLEKAAGLPYAGLTVWEAFEKISDPKQIDTVLIIGAGGGTSSLATLIAKHLHHFETVIVATRAHNVKYMKELGADIVIDYDSEKFEDVIKQWHDNSILLYKTEWENEQNQADHPRLQRLFKKLSVHHETSDKKKLYEKAKQTAPVDLVIDCLGGNDIMKSAYTLLDKHGTFITMGLPQDNEEINSPSATASTYETTSAESSLTSSGATGLKQKVKSVFSNNPKYHWAVCKYDGQKLESLTSWLSNTQPSLLDKLFCKTFSWNRLAEAHQLSRSRDLCGKLIINMMATE